MGKSQELAERGVNVLLKQDDTARMLGVSTYTLQAWRQAGFGPPFVRMRGNDLRYDLRDIDAFIEEQKSRSITEERAKGRRYNGAAESGGFR